MLLSSSRSLVHVETMSLRLLANLGDAVCNLFERERAIARCSSAAKMHRQVEKRVNARAQAQFLDKLTACLDEKELDLVRRARNLKPANYKKTEQALYRHSTAFEVLVGYLYLTDDRRLAALLSRLEDDEEGLRQAPKP